MSDLTSNVVNAIRENDDQLRDEASFTPSQLTIDLCRELYDRFVMGGWEPQDAHAQVEAMIREAFPVQP